MLRINFITQDALPEASISEGGAPAGGKYPPIDPIDEDFTKAAEQKFPIKQGENRLFLESCELSHIKNGIHSFKDQFNLPPHTVKLKNPRR